MAVEETLDCRALVKQAQDQLHGDPQVMDDRLSAEDVTSVADAAQELLRGLSPTNQRSLAQPCVPTVDAATRVFLVVEVEGLAVSDPASGV